jgi:hypothetical protein
MSAYLKEAGMRRGPFPFLFIGVALCAAALRAATTSPVGPRVVAYCQAHLGQKVGNGECAGLAFQALKAAGAKPRTEPDFPGRGDYVWGRPIFIAEGSGEGPKNTGAFTDIQPGDVMQYRNVRFGRTHADHHTAVIKEVDPASGVVKAFAQNGGGRRFVFEITVPLKRLSRGWIRIYRPVRVSR